MCLSVDNNTFLQVYELHYAEPVNTALAMNPRTRMESLLYSNDSLVAYFLHTKFVMICGFLVPQYWQSFDVEVVNRIQNVIVINDIVSSREIDGCIGRVSHAEKDLAQSALD